MLCVVAEVTERVIGERQLAVLRDLGVRLAAAATRAEVMSALEACLAADPRDLPFALVYLRDAASGEPKLTAVHGLARSRRSASPAGDPGTTRPRSGRSTQASAAAKRSIVEAPRRFN